MSANTYEQVRESITTNVVATIASSIKNQHAPFMRDIKAQNFERAFNPTNGNSWEGLNSLMLDIKKAEKKYPSNEWITIKDASFLGAPAAEIEAIKNAWQDKVVKVQYIAKKELVNVHKKDVDGNLIPLKDSQGNQRIGKDNKPLYEFEMIPQLNAKGEPVINPKTNQPYMEIKKEFRELAQPVLKTDLVYNIAEFPTLAKELEKIKEIRAELETGKKVDTKEVRNFNKYKPLNKATEYKHILMNAKDYQADCKKIVLQDIKKQLTPTTAEQLTHYFNAQNFNKDYQVPKGLNERQKQEVQKLIDNGAINLDSKQQENAKEVKNTEQKESKAQEHTQEKAQEKANKPKSKARGR